MQSLEKHFVGPSLASQVREVQDLTGIEPTIEANLATEIVQDKFLKLLSR